MSEFLSSLMTMFGSESEQLQCLLELIRYCQIETMILLKLLVENRQILLHKNLRQCSMAVLWVCCSVTRGRIWL